MLASGTGTWRQRRQGARRQRAITRGTHSVQLAQICRHAPAQQRGSKDRDTVTGQPREDTGAANMATANIRPAKRGQEDGGKTRGHATTKTGGGTRDEACNSRKSASARRGRGRAHRRKRQRTVDNWYNGPTCKMRLGSIVLRCTTVLTLPWLLINAHIERT